MFWKGLNISKTQSTKLDRHFALQIGYKNWTDILFYKLGTKIGQTFCFTNWVQNKGSFLFCIAPGAMQNKGEIWYVIIT